MNPIFTDLAPNTEPDDVRCALQLFVRPWQWSRGEAAQKLEARFRAYLPVAHAFAFASGRSCLFALLKSFGVGPGDEVLLQAYTCVAVPDPALWVGTTPVYVDCEEDTFNMSAADLSLKITPRSKVLIIQHTFGLPADLDRLIAIARAHRLIVIEDCAHALGTRYRRGLSSVPTEDSPPLVGTFGDAAFFSFGRDKVISSVFGGMAVTHNAAIAEKLRVLQSEFRDPPRAWILQQLLHPIVTHAAKCGWGIAGLGKLLLALLKASHIISKPVERAERSGGKPAFAERRMANALAVLVMHQMGKLDRFIAHRRRIAEYFTTHLNVKQISSPLGGEGGVRGNLILPSEPVDCLHGFLRYTIRTPRAKEILTEARSQSIFLGDWYRTPIAPEGVDYKAIGYRKGSCPIAERIAKESVNLPTDIHVTLKDAERIVECLKSISLPLEGEGLG